MESKTKQIIIWLSAIVITFLAVYIVIAYNEPEIDINQRRAGTIEHDDWTKGNPDSAITLIEYSDLQCPACATIHDKVVKPILDEYSDKIYFAYRHFPLKSIHPNAVPAAIAAESAGKQDKFWEMQDILFALQTEWSAQPNPENIFKKYAQDLGLDVNQFEQDLKSFELENKVENHFQTAVNSGLNSTPTIFLNGEKIDVPGSVDDFKALLDKAIEENS